MRTAWDSRMWSTEWAASQEVSGSLGHGVLRHELGSGGTGQSVVPLDRGSRHHGPASSDAGITRSGCCVTLRHYHVGDLGVVEVGPAPFEGVEDGPL